MWVEDVQSLTQFKIRAWSDQGWTVPSVNEPPFPTALNFFDPAVTAQLGLPILVGDRCTGVLWLKFGEREAGYPSPTLMGMARGFAAGAGLVIDVLQHQQEMRWQEGWRKLALKLRERLFPTGPLTVGAGLEGFVIYRPCDGVIGGDFYSSAVLGQSETILIIGDAEFKGPEASLRMLPIVGAFKSVSHESRSTKAVLQKLIPLTDDLQLHATAMCLIIDRRQVKGESVWHLFVSDAGHPPLILITPNGQVTHCPDIQKVFNRGNLGLNLDTPLGEVYEPLEPGTVIIAYSDGVDEAGKGGPHGHLGPLGIQSVASSVIAAGGGPQQIAEAIETKTMERYRGVAEDDVTIMVLRIPNGNGTRRLSTEPGLTDAGTSAN